MSRLLRHEAHSRSLAKAVTWRFTATIDTFVISYIVTGKVVIAGTIAVTEIFHEDFDLLFPRAGVGINPLGSPRSCFPGPRMKAKSVHTRDDAQRIAANVTNLLEVQVLPSHCCAVLRCFRPYHMLTENVSNYEATSLANIKLQFNCSAGRWLGAFSVHHHRDQRSAIALHWSQSRPTGSYPGRETSDYGCGGAVAAQSRIGEIPLGQFSSSGHRGLGQLLRDRRRSESPCRV